MISAFFPGRLMFIPLQMEPACWDESSLPGWKGKLSLVILSDLYSTSTLNTLMGTLLRLLLILIIDSSALLGWSILSIKRNKIVPLSSRKVLICQFYYQVGQRKAVIHYKSEAANKTNFKVN